MRVIAVFEKSERIRHIGHLDIQRAVQRGLRRSGLPVAYSNGFNPHILVTFASALSTGAAGLRELMDVKMAEPVSPELFLDKMNKAMPPEMPLKEAVATDDHTPALMSLLKAAVYDLDLSATEETKKITDAVPELLSCEHVYATRKTKTGQRECDIRPLIYDLTASGNHLLATLALTEKDACKPVMLISALAEAAGICGDGIRPLVIRTALLGEKDGQLLPLEKMI